MTTGFKTTLMEILDGSPKHAASRYVEWLITLVVLVNCSAVILDSVPEIHAEFKEFFHELEFWSVMFFKSEYIAGVWSLGAKYSRQDGGAWKVAFNICSVHLAWSTSLPPCPITCTCSCRGWTYASCVSCVCCEF